GDFIDFQWQMVQDGPGGAGFFGEKTVDGKGPAFSQWAPLQGDGNSAGCVGESTPPFMIAGRSQPVSFTMKNFGTYTWSSAGGYKLGSQLPQDNSFWGLSRVPLPSTVAPSASVTFSFTVTSATTGLYPFEWMMIQEGGVEFFPAWSPARYVPVTSKATL